MSDTGENRFKPPRRFRRLNRWWANAFGYFWLPCPLCGFEFGGHEWRCWVDTIPTGPSSSRGICWNHDSDPAALSRLDGAT